MDQILNILSLSLSLSASHPYLHDRRYNGHDDSDRNVELTAMVGQRLSVVPCGTILPLRPFQPFVVNHRSLLLFLDLNRNFQL
jgi:hypothetical protein